MTRPKLDVLQMLMGMIMSKERDGRDAGRELF